MKTVFLMRKNEKEFTDYSIMKMIFEYRVVLNSIDIFGCLINVYGEEENIKKFMKKFSLKETTEEYYKNNVIEQKYNEKFYIA